MQDILPYLKLFGKYISITVKNRFCQIYDIFLIFIFEKYGI